MKSDVVVIIICIIYLLYVIIAKIRKKEYFDRKLVPVSLFVLIMGVGWLLQSYRSLQYFHNEYIELVNIYENQEYKTAEGVVRVQHMEPVTGHTAGDIILVNGVMFEFRCASSTLGYNEIITFGGVLTEGTMAKIYYYQSGTEFPDQNLILHIDLMGNKSSVDKKNTYLQCTK